MNHTPNGVGPPAEQNSRQEMSTLLTLYIREMENEISCHADNNVNRGVLTYLNATDYTRTDYILCDKCAMPYISNPSG